MKTMRLSFVLAAIVTFITSTALAADARTIVPLNGQWEIAEGGMEQPPAKFSHRAPVPGLVDMATPPFVSPGSSVSLKERSERKRPADPKREAFWYRRTFKLKGPLSEVARLKVSKARYGTKVILNGRVVGEHGPNWTPGWFDVKPFLKGDGAQNELLIRVGASLAQVSPYLTEGWDFEKSRYIPGIFDSVQLVLSGSPHIVNVQVVPEVEKKRVRAAIELASAATGRVKGVVREAKSGRVVGETVVETRGNKVEMTVPIRDARLWTPEDPFLYELAVDTGGDTSRTRFGLRTFKTNPASGRAVLNGRPYFLRGSNVCIYRFFEDAARAGLPWDREWVRKLHRRFKEMHWNSLRYCIGFPPELWYEIADEEGIMIQDEFPIWYGGRPDAWPKEITQQHLAVEFTEWMRERWNHPCVVVWDAQNETTDDAVVAATLMAVRGLDLSNRPWDNGWGVPQMPGDISEAHPYRAGRKGFFANLANETGIPDNGPKKKDAARPPYLINEYGWLWINRDGTLPTLTVDIYKRLLGEKATVAERFHYYARTLAAKTEFWRSKRLCAGVLHFCGLGYSRHDGQTSDHFINVKNLTYEPNFRRYVSAAFAPTGIMLDFWGDELPPGEKRELPVVVINDLYEKWSGTVRFRLLGGAKTLAEQTQPCEVAALGDKRLTFNLAVPAEPGRYTLEAALVRKGAPDVRSLRDFAVLTPEEREARRNLAEGRPVKASSVLIKDGQTYRTEFAVDGKGDTRWSSEFRDPQWLAVDLGAMQTISRVELQWEGAFGKAYTIQVSPDGENWKTVHATTKGVGKAETIRFTPVQARWVRIHGTQRGTPFGYSLWDVRVYH
jgi:hypothetical protein